MMAHIAILLLAFPTAIVAVLLSLVAWREWPLLLLAALAVLSTLHFARGLATLEISGIAFILGSLAGSLWWFGRRRRRVRASLRRG